MALRSGIDNFHFGKNHFPSETSHGNLHLILGLKQIFNNKKQSISISIIGILMSFTMVFAFAMHYNFVLDDQAFLNIIGMEKSDIAVSCYNDQYKEVFKRASELEGVEKALHYSNADLTLSKDDKEVSTACFISNDFSSVEISTIIDGRYPLHDNEIVLSTIIKKKLNAKIGDIVSIKVGTTQCDYLVVGISQHINHLGQSASLTEEGMKRSNPTFIPNTLYLYLDNNQDILKAMNDLTVVIADYNVSVVNMDDAFHTSMSSITPSITLICIVIGMITIFIMTTLTVVTTTLVSLRIRKLNPRELIAD